MENTKTRVGSENEKVCEPCDDCYNLIQDSANKHRDDLKQLGELLTHIAENPEPVGPKFDIQLKKLRVRIRSILVDAKTRSSASADDGSSLRDRLEDLYERLGEVQQSVSKANEQLNDASKQGSS